LKALRTKDQIKYTTWQLEHHKQCLHIITGLTIKKSSSIINAIIRLRSKQCDDDYQITCEWFSIKQCRFNSIAY
jgi:hypothetical protein